MTAFLKQADKHFDKPRRWLAFVFLVLSMATSITSVHAADPLSKSICFFGRWDLRAPDRAITVNTGSYMMVNFTGTSLQAQFDLSGNGTERPTIAWKIDKGDWQEDEIWPVVQLGSNLSAGPHTACLMVRGLDEHDSRWTPPLVAQITFLGFVLPPGGTFDAPSEEWLHPALKIEFLGDSITEGVLVGSPIPNRGTWAWQTDALRSWPFLTATNLGAVRRQVGFGATGLAHGGSGGAPGALDSFNFFYAGCPRDDWQPDVVVINQGANDSHEKPDVYEGLYAKYLALVRTAYPKAKIVAVEPFGGFQGQAIQQAVAAATTAGDKQVYYIDTTGWYSGDLHPNYQASPGIADKLTSALKSQVLGW
jgi:GDSL-like Lipase/Acylhydrolase family